MKIDDYVLKTVPFRFRGADMRLDLSHALFSSNDVDAGSKLLLKAVAQNADPASVGSVLDIGSGVGVLGIACGLGYPGARVSFRDRDALACAFTERNARRNKLAPETVEHALFLEGLEGREFDLVLSNVPAKAGPPVLDRFFRALPRYVSARGVGAVVVVNTIAEAARASLCAALAPAEPRLAELGKGHSVFLFGRAEGSAGSDADSAAVMDFRRGEVVTQRGPGTHRRSGYRFQGYWGLPEFDTPSFATELAMELCEAGSSGLLVRKSLVVNPGVGRLPCFIARRLGSAVELCGRDRLALMASETNLALNREGGETSELRVAASTAWSEGLEGPAYDLMAEYADVTPRVDSFGRSWSEAARLLKAGGSYVAVMTSADFDRFERQKPKGFMKLREKKKKGWACGLWRFEA
jgi:16S rRNA G1207 methylase RsmC